MGSGRGKVISFTLIRRRSPTVYGTLCADAKLVVHAVMARAEKDPKKRVVITGMGVVSCYGNDTESFYDRCARPDSACKASKGM